MRQIERWLHQHIFKVGWLLTKNFQTTTVLYYTFFLPGVFLNQFVYWLAAGMLDVRAERVIKWPQKQDIGELRLDFIKLSKKASRWRVAIISLMPFLAGLAFVLFVADTIFDLSGVLNTMSAGSLEAIAAGVDQLLSTPDFWLWAYLLFTVGNTMNPDFKQLKGLQWVGYGLLLVLIPLVLLGVGDEVIGTALSGPVASVLNALSTAFVVVILFDLLAVLTLGMIESILEYITGDSATFKNGKMVVMTREQVKAEREKERKKARQKQQRRKTAPAGPPSIYHITLPIPGPPGEESVTPLPSTVVESDEEPQPAFDRPKRDEPDVVTGESRASEGIRINTPGNRPGDDGNQSDEASREDEAESAEVSSAGTERQSTVRSPSRYGIRSFGSGGQSESDADDDDAAQDEPDDNS